ncbi:unnamed protein product [Paramecium sonneborni]|uniref:B box-type domain-containing protein n=1 Tax=Paramecium sonneborni TaxID=65129 RepID=A0A8S1QTY3_9CILI|nr:unnamed protein product [Paramecium sonneborni]
MFRFFGKLMKRAPKECLQHDHQKFPNLLANEFCQSCEQSLCYMCGNDHIGHHHPVKVSHHCYPNMNLQNNENLSEKDNLNLTTLRAFNTGSLIQLDINKLQCICGKPADENTAICAACGSATCSQQCHQELVNQDKCKFHHNFTEKAKLVSLRSILLKNAYFLFDKGYAQGTVFSRTSQNFISAFLTSQRSSIYLQRGFRQYGNPEIQTLNAMDIVNGADLDYEIHLMKVCQCKCSHCKNLGNHPMHLCQSLCKSRDLYIFRSYAQENPVEKEQTCECQCQFCQSGHTILSHKKIDCCLKCEFKQKVDF